MWQETKTLKKSLQILEFTYFSYSSIMMSPISKKKTFDTKVKKRLFVEVAWYSFENPVSKQENAGVHFHEKNVWNFNHQIAPKYHLPIFSIVIEL